MKETAEKSGGIEVSVGDDQKGIETENIPNHSMIFHLKSYRGNMCIHRLLENPPLLSNAHVPSFT